MTNIDTAIAAWKGATTQADRDLAAVAIEEHIAHETPEGGDYQYATSELISRLKAEFGPVPTEDLRIDTRDMNGFDYAESVGRCA